MRVFLLQSLAVLALSACSATEGIVQDTSRKAAKQVVSQVIDEKFPGNHTKVYTDCVIDNATTDEIFSLAKAAVTGVDESTVKTVVNIGSRKATLICIGSSNRIHGM